MGFPEQVADFIAGCTNELSGRRRQVGTAAGICVALGASGWYANRLFNRRVVKRPYVIKDIASLDDLEDPVAELTKVIEWLQDAVVRPIDALLPGHPFAYDMWAFPFTPMVLLIGNHSAGKSTFINRLLGASVQDTGVAPTDDGFTVLERHETLTQPEDGPTLLGCRENRPFKDLQRFGQAFWGHLQRKRMKLSKDSKMPYGLQVVDTPGMIDLPTKQADAGYGGRGYNFLEVVRWFGKHADLILLLFDPDKPGTTGEALDVLTKSLSGLDHKFLIVLNKVDRLDSSLDFARAYGTLGWALSKVIPRKDIPMIYTMFNEGFDETAKKKEHGLSMEPFREKRDEVMTEVYRAKARHWDNIITSMEDTLRQVQMVATVLNSMKDVVWMRRKQIQLGGTLALMMPAAIACRLLSLRWGPPSVSAMAGLATSYIIGCYGAFTFLQDHCRQHEALQVINLDGYFREAYKEEFIHSDGEDFRARWATVRPRIVSMLNAVPTAAALPTVPEPMISCIEDLVKEDVFYLRQIARVLRSKDA